MATSIGVAEFWDSLDDSQRNEALLVHKYELLQQVTDEKDKYLCVFTVCTIEEELNRLKSSKTQHTDPLSLNISKDGIYDLSVSSGSSGRAFAQCTPGQFVVSQTAVEQAIRSLDPQQALPPLNFSADKVCLRCLDMLTYPRPVRKFKLIVERQVMLSDLRNLLAADVGISEEDLVLMIKGKEVPRDDNKPLQELGVKDNQQVVISKRLGAPSAPTTQTVDWSRQFVGDLLFGQTSNQEQKSYTVAKLVNVTQGYQLLPLVLERRVIQKVLALYAEDQRARANEAELIRLLEMEKKGRSEEEERKKKKKQKKKEKEKKRKDQASPRAETGAEAKTSVPPKAPAAEPRNADKEQEEQSSSPPPLAATVPAQEEKPALSQPDASATATGGARACASCGVTLDARHRFCWQCGTPAQLEEAQQQPSPDSTEQEAAAAAATGAASASRRKRKNKKHASQHRPAAAGASSEKPSSEQTTNQKQQQQQQQQSHSAETRSSRLPSAETDEELSGSPAADYYILEDMYRQGRSNSRDASIDGFLTAVTMPREPAKSKSRLPFFKQLT